MPTNVVAKTTTPPKALKLVLKSWGIKRFGVIELKQDNLKVNVLPVADLYLDCRGIKEHGEGINRNDYKTFSESIKKSNALTLEAMITTIQDSVAQIPARRFSKADPYADPYVICFFCAWGMNRSPTTKHVLAQQLFELGYNVEIVNDNFYSPSTLSAE